MTKIMPVPRNSHITVLRPPSIIAAVFPYVQPYQHRKGKLRAHKVLNGKPQKLQKLVRQAAVPEEGTHHGDRGGHRDHHRHQECRAEKACAPEFSIQRQRQQERQRHQQRHAHGDKPEGISRRQAKGRAAEQIGIVLQPRKADPSRTGGEGLLDAPQERDQVQQSKARQKGQSKAHAGEGVSFFQFHEITSSPSGRFIL